MTINDERRQELIDAAVATEQADHPRSEVDVIESVVTEIEETFEYIVYLVYILSSPAWETSTGVAFPASTRVCYTVRPSLGGGAGGFLS
jgi:hypothetical protein